MIIGTTKFAAFESLYMHMIELIDVGRKINRQILKIVSSLAGNHITDETWTNNLITKPKFLVR